MEIFKQDQYAPVAVEKQVLTFYALVNGFMDDVPVEKISELEKGLCEYAETASDDVLKEIAEKKELDENLEEKVKMLIEEYKNAR